MFGVFAYDIMAFQLKIVETFPIISFNVDMEDSYA